MKIFQLLILGLLQLPCFLFAQPTQTIRGRVIDAYTQQPIQGVVVMLEDSSLRKGAISSAEGLYRIEGIPVGRQRIRTRHVGYEAFLSDNLILNSARELVLDIPLATKTLEGATLEWSLTKINPHEPENNFQLSSARSFGVEETQRYPSSVNDPSRMAMAFPGVQASQDNNSDIIIRSNSPVGLLWRLEGIDIPNPNHFARKGSSGGGISMFSAQLLGNSDFSTGAFAAEYGNAMAGVFDMKFRPGNNQQREFRFKFGLLGTDLAAEGPIKKARDGSPGGYSSYLVNYRYSTLGILNDLGFRLVGERIDNNFQDLSFNFSFTSADRNTTLTLFGVGGKSEELWDPVADSLNWSRPYRESRTYTTDMGVAGATLTHLLDEKSFIKAVVAVMGDQVTDNDDTLDIANVALSSDPNRLEEETDWKSLATARYETEVYNNSRISTHVFYQRQLQKGLTLRTGLIGTHMKFQFSHQRRQTDSSAFQTLVDGAGASQLLQAYAQVRANIGNRLSISTGIHSLFLTLNQSYSVEPRFAMRYQLAEKRNLTFAYGLHGQVIPLGSYYTEVTAVDGSLQQPNLDLKPAKSHHLVLGFEQLFDNNLRINVEAYYQRLFDMPVSPQLGPHEYWFLNQRDGYASDELSSTGTGQNYGLDLSVEKFFSKGLFFLFSSSLYDSQFQYEPDPTTPSLPEAKSYNTRYNSRYQVSGMIGGEIPIGEKANLQLGARTVLNGGLRYTPGDEAASQQAGEYVPQQTSTFSESNGTYFRIDTRIAYRQNLKKTAYIISLDLQNVTNRRNVRDQVFDPGFNRLQNRLQSGLIPVLSFQLDF